MRTIKTCAEDPTQATCVQPKTCRKGTVKEMDNLMVIVTATITDLQDQERKLRK